jgi:hypothetical protein
MLLSIAVACAVFALLSLPGWILVAKITGKLWVYVAAGFCSQAAVILLTAVISLLVPGQIPILAMIGVAALLCAAAFVWRPRTDGPALPPVDPWAFVVPICATLTAALITHSAIALEDGDLLVRAFYNADGFKHLGHVQAVAAFGLPARDIFAAGDPLAYYWFFHAVPALGAVLHGNAVQALIAGGLVQVFAFWIVVYGLVRSAGANSAWAAVFSLIAFLSPSLDGLTALVISGFDLTAAATGINIEGVNAFFLHASSLFRASLYIPQHLFMLAGLLSWATLEIAGRAPSRALRLLALAPLVAAGGISTMLGVPCLIVYALTRLMDREDSLVRRLGEIAVVWVLAAALPVALGFFDLSIDNPTFADKPLAFGTGARLLLAIPGLLFVFWVALLGLVGLQAAWRARPLPVAQGRTFHFALALTAVGILGLLLSALVDQQRVALEFALRVSFLGWLGLVIGAAWLLDRTEQGPQTLKVLRAAALFLLVLGLATPVLDAAWHSASGARWIVRIPKDDLAVLRAIREETPKDAVVLQSPAMPFLDGGLDVWVPPVGGRMVFMSPRATHWGDKTARYDQALAFFEGKGKLPDGAYSHIYLSRALEPQTFDGLMRRLSEDAGWRRATCLPDACLWEKAP